MRRVVDGIVWAMIFLAAWSAVTVLSVFGADIVWARFRGRVKAVDLQARTLTILDTDGDLLTIPVTDDVIVMEGNTERTLKDLTLNHKVTLLRVPREHIQNDAPPPPVEHKENP